MKKNVSLFAFITIFLLFVIYVIETVSTGSVIYQYVESIMVTGGIYYSIQPLLFVEIISSGLVVILCVVILCLILKRTETKKIYLLTSITLFISTLFTGIIECWAYVAIKGMHPLVQQEVDIPIPHVAIVELVFIFISTSLFGASVFLQWKTKREDLARILGLIGFGALFIVSFINLTSLNGDSGAIAILESVSLFFVVAFGSYLFAIPFLSNKSNLIAFSNNDDDYISLMKLKKLYDDGVITSEEYNEKRQKYIDKL